MCVFLLYSVYYLFEFIYLSCCNWGGGGGGGGGNFHLKVGWQKQWQYASHPIATILGFAVIS